jgi:ElaB/YqjD/DUF883 family membrane-anchored ribosome-binding protein
MTDYKSLYEESQKEIEELKEECATRQADYDEKCKELEGLEDMEAKVTDALWDEEIYECRVDLVIADIHKLRKENEKLKEENHKLHMDIKELNKELEYEADTSFTELTEEIEKLKETLEKKDKQIERLVRNKKNREKQLIHIRAICENTDEYIEEKVSEKMDEYVVKKQNDEINKLKELLN